MKCRFVPKAKDNSGASISYLELNSIFNIDNSELKENKIKELYKLVSSDVFLNEYKKYNPELIQGEISPFNLVKYINKASTQEKFPAISALLYDVSEGSDINTTSLYTIESLSNLLGINYKLDYSTDSQAIAYYENGTTVFNVKNLNNREDADNIIYHEFTHPIIDHIQSNDSRLFDFFVKEAKNILSSQEMSEIRKLYDKEDALTLSKEIIVRAVDKLRNSTEQDKPNNLLQTLKKYIKYVLSNLFSNIAGPTHFNKYQIDTLQDVAQFMRQLPNSLTNFKLDIDTSLKSAVRQKYIGSQEEAPDAIKKMGLEDVINRLFDYKSNGTTKVIQGIENFSIDNSEASNFFSIDYTRSTLKVTYPNGETKSIRFKDISQLRTIIESEKRLLIKAVEAYAEKYSSDLSRIMNIRMPDPGDKRAIENYEKELQNINTRYTIDMMGSLIYDISNNKPDEVYNYATFKQLFPTLAMPNFNDDNLIVTVRNVKDKNGNTINKVYNLISPYVGFNDRTKEYESFAKKIYKSDSIARQNGFTISDNIKGIKSINAAMLAMHIAINDNTAKFESVKTFNIFDPRTIEEINLEEAVSNILSLESNLPDFISFISLNNEYKELKPLEEQIKSLAENVSKMKSDRRNSVFKQSYIQLLFSHDLGRKNSQGVSYNLFQNFNTSDIENDQPLRDRLKRSIEKRLRTIVKNYEHSIDGLTGKRKFESLNTDIGKEYLLLSLALMELDGNRYGVDLTQLNRDMTMDNSLESWIKGQGDYFDSFTNFVMSNVRKIMARVKEKFIIYQREKNKFFEDYFKELKEFNSFKNIAFNYKEDLYTNLYEYKMVRVMDKVPIKNKDNRDKIITNNVFRKDANGEFIKKRVKTGRLKDPTTSGLTKFEKQLILKTAKTIRDAVKELVRSKYDNGELPSAFQSKGNFEEAFADWELQSMGATFKGNTNDETVWGNYLMLPAVKKDVIASILSGNFREAIDNFAELEFNMNNMSLDKDSKHDSKSLGLLEVFVNRASNSPEVNNIYGNRLGALGLETDHSGEVYLVNETKNKGISMDLQSSLDFYMMKLYKQQEANDLNYLYYVGRTGLIYEELRSRKNKTVELDTLEHVFMHIVHDEMQKAGFGTGNKDVSKVISGTTALTSKIILSYNIPSAVVAVVGANMSLFTTALSKKYGERFFTVKDWASATKFVLNPSNQKLVNHIMHTMQFHSSDEKSLIFNENLKAGTKDWGQFKGMLVGRNSMYLQGLGDYEAKAIMLVAQLKKDGILEYFTFDKDGNLYYDWDAEERDAKTTPNKFSKFRNRDREVHKQELKRDNRAMYTITKTVKGKTVSIENPLVPYDERMMDSLSTIASHMLGQVSDKQRGKSDTNTWAKAFFQMKSYIRARANNFYSRGFTNPNISWYDVDTDGNTKIEFYYQEGAVNTLISYIKLVRQLGLGNAVEALGQLKPEQQANLKKMLIEFIIFAAAAAAYGFGVDDEDKNKNPYHFYIKQAINDIVGIYNPMDYFGAITTPATIVYATRLGNALLDGMQFEFDSALKLSGATKNFTQVTSFFDQLEANIK